MQKEEILRQLRERWDIALQEGEDIHIDIQLLTADGNPGQPLAYDIVQQSNGADQTQHLCTYTWVEQPTKAEALLGMADATYDQLVDALQVLLTQAQSSVDSLPVDSLPVETLLVSEIKNDGVGMTYGQYLLSAEKTHTQDPRNQSTFPTNYQAYFITDNLRRLQLEQTGILFNRITASLDSSNRFSLQFG